MFKCLGPGKFFRLILSQAGSQLFVSLTIQLMEHSFNCPTLTLISTNRYFHMNADVGNWTVFSEWERSGLTYKKKKTWLNYCSSVIRKHTTFSIHIPDYFET